MGGREPLFGGGRKFQTRKSEKEKVMEIERKGNAGESKFNLDLSKI